MIREARYSARRCVSRCSAAIATLTSRHVQLLSSNRMGEARSAYREVQERHQDIQRIEKTLTELAQLFNDVSGGGGRVLAKQLRATVHL